MEELVKEFEQLLKETAGCSFVLSFSTRSHKWKMIFPNNVLGKYSGPDLRLVLQDVIKDIKEYRVQTKLDTPYTML